MKDTYVVLDTYFIKSRGLVLIISLSENKISDKIKEAYNELLHKHIHYNNIEYVVKGVESFGTGENVLRERVGLLVKEI